MNNMVGYSLSKSHSYVEEAKKQGMSEQQFFCTLWYELQAHILTLWTYVAFVCMSYIYDLFKTNVIVSVYPLYALYVHEEFRYFELNRNTWNIKNKLIVNTKRHTYIHIYIYIYCVIMIKNCAFYWEEDLHLHVNKHVVSCWPLPFPTYNITTWF